MYLVFTFFYSVTFYDLSVSKRGAVQTSSNICRKNEMFYNLKNWKLKDKSLIDVEIWENVIQAKVSVSAQPL